MEGLDDVSVWIALDYFPSKGESARVAESALYKPLPSYASKVRLNDSQ